jgi:peptide deformylase
MKLLYYPNKFLEKQMSPVDLSNPGFDPAQLKHQMVEVMLKYKGIGLAANQIGLDAQVFVLGDSHFNSSIMINPTILQYTEETVDGYEGCLSFPNIYIRVKRPAEILAKFWNEKLEETVIKISGPTAKVYLHELDHLLGITVKDRTSKLKWDMAKKKAAKLSR